MNHCGSCTACCRVFNVAEINKPAGVWCHHCTVGIGCKIYSNRPSACVEFECFWLMSQKRPDKRERLPPELRPDKCKVVIAPSTHERVLAALTMPGAPLAWERKDVRKVIDMFVDEGMSVVCGAAGSTRRTMVDSKGTHEVRLTEADETGMQYNIKD